MAYRAKDTRLSAGEIEEIIDLIPERLKPGVLSGELVVRPQEMWYNPEKPVIVDAHNNHIKSGRYKTANNPAIVSKQFAYKRKKGYKEMQAKYIGAEPGEDQLQITSLKEIIETLMDAANGSPQEIDCPHPEQHRDYRDGPIKHVVAFKKDANTLFKLYENLVGRATETTDINVNQTTLVKLLQDTTRVNELTVIELPPNEAYEKQKLIEGSFKDVGEDPRDK